MSATDLAAPPTLDVITLDPTALDTGRPRGQRRDLARRVLGSALSGLISVAVILGAWQLFLVVFHVNAFIGKGPVDVWHYLFTNADAGTHRSAVLDESLITLRDAFLGLAVGTLAAVGAALAFNLWRAVEQTMMPMAMVLRSVPLVAMTPLIVLIFGRDLSAVTVIAGIVTFFPTLVNVTLALRGTPASSLDLCRAYGASPRQTLWKVQVPSALPMLFASLRIAAPLALIGAMLAEWLATGKGLGFAILSSTTQFDYTGLWARVAAVTIYSLLLYGLIGMVERRMLERFGPTRA